MRNGSKNVQMHVCTYTQRLIGIYELARCLPLAVVLLNLNFSQAAFKNSSKSEGTMLIYIEPLL